MSFGLATIGVLLAFANEPPANEPATNSLTGSTYSAGYWSLVLWVLIPVICLVVFKNWASEVRRGRRASMYLRGLERTINANAGRRLLHWEEDLRTHSDRRFRLFRGHYYATACAFWAIATCSAWLGMHSSNWVWLASHATSACIVLSVGTAAFFAFTVFPFGQFDKVDPKWPEPVREA